MSENKTLITFQKQQEKAKVVLEKLKHFVSVANDLGIAVDKSILGKITNVAEVMENGSKLKIALIGGFSEGKTSIAAAWMEKYDKNTMNISQKESSNAVNVYGVGDDIELIDTPGLFGFKEQFNAELGEIEKYKEITKKYVSEAHIVLYVMNPANPIKESHKDDLVWLFRTLNLLPRTVFVLSRFDEVADVEDDADYKEKLEIKKGNIIGRLKEVIKLTNEEEQDIKIVGVAANPFNMGTEYWLQNLGQLKQLSRIETLQEATTKSIEGNGGQNALVYEMQKSVIQDILTKQLPVAKEQEKQIHNAVLALQNNCKDLLNSVSQVERRIIEVQNHLIGFITQYLSGLIMQADGCGMETVQDFMTSEIGEEGCIMYAKIQNEFRLQTDMVNAELKKSRLNFDAAECHFEATIGDVEKKGLDFLKGSGIINAKNILTVRDGIQGLGKMLGTDFGGFLKFKPWGAVNLAKNLGTFLQALGPLLEAYDAYKRNEMQNKFNRSMKEFTDGLRTMQKELLNLVQGSDFAEKFFPEYVGLQEALSAEEKNIIVYKEKQQKFVEWFNEGETIEAEYRVL